MKGYNNLPHANTEKVKTLTILFRLFIDTPAAHMQFDLDYPSEIGEHCFMVSFKGVVLF